MLNQRLILVSIFLLFIPAYLLADEQKEADAIKATGAWLSNIDAGNYAESYDTTSSYLKNAVNKAEWETALTATRKPLGDVLSRELAGKKYTTSLPGAPDGEYVVIQYKTSFENKYSAIEVVTPALEKDGSWRVSGYYIK